MASIASRHRQGHIATHCTQETADAVHWQRRAFLGKSAGGMLGSIAWSWLNAIEGGQGAHAAEAPRVAGPHHAPRAERIICLFQNGGPSQMDLFVR